METPKGCKPATSVIRRAVSARQKGLSAQFPYVFACPERGGIARVGNRSVRVSVFFLQIFFFSALCCPNQQKFGTLLTCPKVISPPKNLPNLSTDCQENATFSQKVTNSYAVIPSSGHSRESEILWPLESHGARGRESAALAAWRYI